MTWPPSNFPSGFVVAGSTTSAISERDALIGFGFKKVVLAGAFMFPFGILSSAGPILVGYVQPLYYLHTMPDQKKTRREVLESFVAQKPDDAFSRYGLAMECINTGDTAAAESNFRELLQRNAHYVPAYLMFAQLLAKQSRPDDAREVLTRGIAAASKAGNAHALSEMESLLNEL
jgi:hypothetical protein